MKQQHLQASEAPVQVISGLAYPGQPQNFRLYRKGYESFFNLMPVLESGDEMLKDKMKITELVLENMVKSVKQDGWTLEDQPGEKQFKRTIIAISNPIDQNMHSGRVSAKLKPGPEVIIAQWGKGFDSPVHGHAPGLLYENILSGRIRVNAYRIVNLKKKIVRPMETMIVTDGVFLSTFTQGEDGKRDMYVHNYHPLEPSVSLHFVPEYTRDGRDNKFEPEFFEDVYGLMMKELIPTTSQEAIYRSQSSDNLGDVYLVRSKNVEGLGDHYIVITGHPVQKENGLRPQNRAIQAPHTAGILDVAEDRSGLKLLRLNEVARKAFHKFHGITVEENKVVFQS